MHRLRISRRASRDVPALLLVAIVGLTGCSEHPLGPDPGTSVGPPAGVRSMHASDVDCDVNDDLRSTIDALEADGTLNAGRATALRSKLDQADRWAAEGDSEKAAEALQRLIEQVEAWVAEGALSEEDAAGLLACAEDVADGPDVDFAYIDAGGAHTCGLTTAGAAYCWGSNAVGQLGDGTNADSNTPVAVDGGLSFITISLGSAHTCGLTAAGVAYCWGSNFRGQLGDGTNTDSDVPRMVDDALNFAGISAGGFHSCGVTATGNLYCWGRNLGGQLGDGTNTDSNTPVVVDIDDEDGPFIDIDAGGLHSCAVASDGDAYCWGENGLGMLGDGTNINSNTPVIVNGGLDLEFASISAGSAHTCAVTTAAAAYCWGSNSAGKLGDGTTTSSPTPVIVFGGLSFAGISARASHTCAMTTTGAGHCWGHNAEGQLGDGTNDDSSAPVAVGGGLTFTSIDAGGLHTCGVTVAGNAYCWGENGTGELGDGTNANSNTPVAVIAP